MKFKGKELGNTWLSKGSKKDYKTKETKFFITSSNGVQFEYGNEEKRDKDYKKALETFQKITMEIGSRIFAKKFGIKVK